MQIIKNKLNKFLLILTIILISISASSCDLKQDTTPLDPSTFDNFASEIFNLVLNGDDLSTNYLFENIENYNLEPASASLPTPSNSSVLSSILINTYFAPLKRYVFEELNFDQQMTYIVISELITFINETFGMNYLKSDYLGSYLGYQAQLPLLLVEYNLRNEHDIENYFKYLELIPETFKRYVEYEIEKADNGYGMPNFVIDKVIDQCESFANEIKNVIKPHFMVEMFNNKIDNLLTIEDAKKIEYKTRNEELIKTKVLEGYTYIKDNLNVVYDRATNNMGLAHYVTEKGIEIGKEYYEAIFKRATGYDMPVSDAIIYLQSKLDSKLNEYRQIYQNNPQVTVEIANIKLMDSTPDVQLEKFQSIIYSDFPQLELEEMPKTTVRYIDESMEDHFSPAAYMVSAIDNYTEEFIYLNNKHIYTTNSENERVLDYNYLYTTLAHEGFPGHMYQNIYFKNTNSNVLRKVLKNSGYVEGWATYTELYSYNFLKGIYSDEALRFLRLNDEVNGIIQARLDLGIHYEGWTKNEAEEFLGNYISTYNKNSASYKPNQIDKVYEQLVEIPTNSQKYFFSYLKLEDMYLYAKESSDFNPVDFHKIILDCGPVPLRYIEEIIKTRY